MRYGMLLKILNKTCEVWGEMAKLTAKVRKKIPTGKFALPKERKYPVQDKAHAANAKARAQQQYDKGNISKSTLSKIDSAANKVLKKSEKGDSKMKDKNKSGSMKKEYKKDIAKKPAVKKAAPKKAASKKPMSKKKGY